MRNKLTIAVVQSVLLLMILAASPNYALPDGISNETVYSGNLDKRPEVKSSLIRDGEALEAALTSLGVDDPLPEIDFDSEAVVLITSADDRGGLIRFTDAEIKDGVLEVRYARELKEPVPEKKAEPAFPFTIVKIAPAPSRGTEARFVQSDGKKGLVTSGTGLGHIEPYNNVLEGGASISMAEYMPLENGNTWTYSLKSDNEAEEMTNTIYSEDNGWSAFETFFGIPYVGMRISPDGEILVRVGSTTKAFYTSDVVMDFTKKKVVTPAGTFEDVIVVSANEDAKFWFRDVYAKGVGLVLHEQKSPDGKKSEFSLVSAKVGGKSYPVGE